MKQCSICNQHKPADAYRGTRSACRECENARRREWYAAQTVKPHKRRRVSYVCHICAASMIESDEAMLRQALEALKKVAQSLEWYAHGRCRGFDAEAPLPTHAAVELAERTLAKVRA